MYTKTRLTIAFAIMHFLVLQFPGQRFCAGSGFRKKMARPGRHLYDDSLICKGKQE